MFGVRRTQPRLPAGAFFVPLARAVERAREADMGDDVTVRKALAADLPLLHPVIERAYRGDSARQGWTR